MRRPLGSSLVPIARADNNPDAIKAPRDLRNVGYELGRQRLHIVVFPQTIREAEFFVDTVPAGERHKVVSREAANDPFKLLQRYLRANAAGNR